MPTVRWRHNWGNAAARLALIALKEIQCWRIIPKKRNIVATLIVRQVKALSTLLSLSSFSNCNTCWIGEEKHFRSLYDCLSRSGVLPIACSESQAWLRHRNDYSRRHQSYREIREINVLMIASVIHDVPVKDLMIVRRSSNAWPALSRPPLFQASVEVVKSNTFFDGRY